MGSVNSKGQLIRQKRSITAGIVMALTMGFIADFTTFEGLHKAYTGWNVAMVAVNRLFNLGWENFLFCNSWGLLASFKTACADKLFEETVRKKGNHSSLVFQGGDFMLHYFPVFYLAGVLMRKGKRIPQFWGFMSLMYQHYYCYSQAGGGYDVSKLYAPHDMRTAWAGTYLGQLLAPSLCNMLVERKYMRAALIILATYIPYMLKKVGFITWEHPNDKSVDTEPAESVPESAAA